MHLLQAQPGQIDDGTEAVDLAQSPADVVFLTAADTEIAALAAARRELGPEAPALRLANLMFLKHPMSVDQYVENTVAGARLVVGRFLGGVGYWSYCIEEIANACREKGIAFAALPGDEKPDADLKAVSTLNGERYEDLHRYLSEGGPANYRHWLALCRTLLEGGEAPPPPKRLMRAGLYWPGREAPSLAEVQTGRARPAAMVVFYRALLQGGSTEPVDALIGALEEAGLQPVPVFVASLKEELSADVLRGIMAEARPDIVLNLTAFAVGKPGEADGSAEILNTVLESEDTPVLQVVMASSSEAAWAESMQGLGPRDIAMHVALPEVDGRVLSRAISFKAEAAFDEDVQCAIVTPKPRADRVRFVAELARNWTTLRRKPAAERKVALVLANYPNRDGRLANGVGLDTPASTVGVLSALRDAGYRIEGAPEASKVLMDRIMAGPTNWLTDRTERTGGVVLATDDYRRFWEGQPEDLRRTVEDRWGAPETDPFHDPARGGFVLSVIEFGNAVVAVQPARGYQIDPKESYHSPDLPPPHGYLAFYCWLRRSFGADAIVHLGKHGNLEWLPGKALALSESCFPEAALGALPHLYPFIVNDPGEGSQAKRRSAAVIVDHLTPPMTRAETYGALKDLEALVDEYYDAAGLDRRRLEHLKKEILSLVRTEGLDADAGIAPGDDEEAAFQALDNYLCELKEAQIRDGLHVFGQSPDGRQRRDLLVALARVPGRNHGSLHRAIADDLGLGFDPLDCDLGAPWTGPKPDALAKADDAPWRTAGDTVERIELLAAELVASVSLLPPPRPSPIKGKGEEETGFNSPLGEVGAERRVGGMPESAKILDRLDRDLAPALDSCGAAEMTALLRGLDGRFVPPGPSGAPTRGRADVLPTGRNFFSIDSRAMPTEAAWTLGWKSASRLIERHMQDQGDWPRTMALTAWGTSNMRTGGDDIAQALALIGARPVWEKASRRVTGFEIIPATALGRPRVDVTLRISGFFRDAFPVQIDLFDSAVRAIMALDESPDDNPLAAAFVREAAQLADGGLDRAEAERRAGYRIFGAKPGAYGAGLQALIDERLWENRGDLADSFLNWGGYAYGAGAEGDRARGELETRLANVEAVVQNQDNREHDILDSDDYYQFEGGMNAAVTHLRGAEPVSYHNDHSRPQRPVIRTLSEEVGRVVRSRAANPKWIEGVMRHGYKGAFEIAATVDYLFAFAATTSAVGSHHFDLLYRAYLADDAVRGFIAEHNPAALKEIAARLDEAIRRGFWRPQANDATVRLNELIEGG
ncbi:cobaltochelatase subunit CobN [Minwuia thermotolerans]|uniref:Cobaltochelatase subunit CobN n=1 Tax=Minwuia thermotolerans TaxID=2056226 RepID=A0A2M9G5Y9_9PROT|nr:cobaltochelatase subunit CobN [Minwuia thermotolerans]PJK31135.1 cobaltochelatase subunit CobN [Minwuia thermotolerans]